MNPSQFARHASHRSGIVTTVAYLGGNVRNVADTTCSSAEDTCTPGHVADDTAGSNAARPEEVDLGASRAATNLLVKGTTLEAMARAPGGDVGDDVDVVRRENVELRTKNVELRAKVLDLTRRLEAVRIVADIGN
jgi:hypothetical protein